MIDLYNAKTNQLLRHITEADLQVLVDALEEESLQDQDYYIDRATIDVIADGRATEHLVGLLRGALAAADGVDTRWEARGTTKGPAENAANQGAVESPPGGCRWAVGDRVWGSRCRSRSREPLPSR